MSNGIVTNWSESPPHPPFVTIGISLVSLFILRVYFGLSPVMQQVMIEVIGMQPSEVAALFHQPISTWWDISLLSPVTALFVHANWLHLLGNLAYLWVFGIMVGVLTILLARRNMSPLESNRTL